MKERKAGYAPREVFEEILKWAVIPTFDLVIEYGEQGVVLVKRKIPPYQHKWALPGLRMFKGEEIGDTLKRIAGQELGIVVVPEERRFLGQFVGRFKTENNRQDLSTGYLLRVASDQQLRLNTAHFSSYKFVKTHEEIPDNIGAMYRYYLGRYFNQVP